jgi:hypothetical protein
VLGIVEGLGNTISNLTIAAQHGKTIGLFGTIGVGGTVRDLALTSVSVSDAGGNAAVLGTLAGTNYGSIIGCYADGVITPPNGMDAGGLVGLSVEATIANSEASVAIAGGGYGAMGGPVAEMDAGEVIDSFARGAISNSELAGGLVGVVYQDYAEPQIVNSYASGNLTAGTYFIVGGLVGDGADDTFIVEDSYWDTTTTGTNETDDGAGTGLTNSQLQAGLPPGFDPTIWAETPGVMGGLPYLLTVPR